MKTGIIIAVVFLSIIILIKRSEIAMCFMEFIYYLNERKHVPKKHVTLKKTRLKKLRVVEPLTEEQIPQVKKHIKEIIELINRHLESIHRHRDEAITLTGSSGLITGRMIYEKEYTKQVDMINAAVPQLITEADRISAYDEEYKQQIHDLILSLRKSLEDYDPKCFKQMVKKGNANSQNLQ